MTCSTVIKAKDVDEAGDRFCNLLSGAGNLTVYDIKQCAEGVENYEIIFVLEKNDIVGVSEMLESPLTIYGTCEFIHQS